MKHHGSRKAGKIEAKRIDASCPVARLLATGVPRACWARLLLKFSNHDIVKRLRFGFLWRQDPILIITGLITQLIRCLSTLVAFPTLALWALSLSACSRVHALDQAKPSYPSTLSGGAPCGSCIAPANLSWKTLIPPNKEPGEPLDILGTIYQPDGVTPAEGIVLFVYHTDVTGYYYEEDDASHPRLKGWMKTGADGRYEFRTIKPGAYPNRSSCAHSRPSLRSGLVRTFD